MGLLYAQDCFEFRAEPTKPTPHPCGLPWAIKVRKRASVAVDPAVTARATGGTATARASLLPWDCHNLAYLPAHRREKVRSHMRIDCSPAPRRAPVTFSTHLLQLGCAYLCASFHRCGCVVFFLFTGHCKSCAEKATAKESFPLVRASDSLRGVLFAVK